MSQALQGVVVVDVTTELFASLAAALLGDFGAEVIRLDPAATAPPHPAPRWDYRHELAQRNKSSVVVDLGSERGRALVRELVQRADVFITDRPLAVLAEMGLDAAALSTLKPDLVYARGSGFGPKGPDRDLPAIDELAAARTGMMPILGQPGQPPVYPGHGQMYTTVMLAFAVVTALLHRRRTGEGQQVDASLLAGNMYGASLDLQAFLAIGGERFLEPVSRLDAGNPMSGVNYPTSDGRWVTLTMPDTDRWWPLLGEIVGLDVDDERFNSHDKRCDANRLEMMRVLDERFRARPASHWRRLFAEKKMSADVIEDYSHPMGDPQVYRNRYIVDVDDPSLGLLKMLGFPIHMTETPAGLHRRAPARGQHTAEVLHRVLGYSTREIVELKEQGVVR